MKKFSQNPQQQGRALLGAGSSAVAERFRCALSTIRSQP